MKITLLCSDTLHPVNNYLKAWMESQKGVHDVDLLQKKNELTGGDILFMISCSEIITVHDREKYSASLVLHASDLPKGRGWSPHIWEIANGAEFITLSLLEAEDKLDSGKIWKKIRVPISRSALWDEINHTIFEAEINLINFAIEEFDIVSPLSQDQIDDVSYYAKRTPLHSRIDVNKTLAEQFDLIRVCDPKRYPAFFEYLGTKYILKLEKNCEQ